MNEGQIHDSLRGLDWDGRRLVIDTRPGAAVEVHFDGAPFARLVADASGRVTLGMPYAPGGHATLALGLVIDGTPAGRPVGIVCGRPGLVRAPAPALPLRPVGTEETVDALAPDDPLGREVAIVVPVYDAAEAVRACLDSVLAQTARPARLIVIDDASPDPAIAPLLAGYASRRGVAVLRNATNRGFTATANRGIAEAGQADVVLLNADTEVAPGWLDGLRQAAWVAADIASATAVSDNAGAFSVPELERENPFPAGWNHGDAARVLRQQAGLVRPALPTGNGFCLYLRRDWLERIGPLDEAAFPQGYGEENDWCQRAEAHGGRHVIAGNVLVRHARSQSFGHERRQRLGEAGMAVLRERYPQYEAAVGATLHSFERRVLDWRVRRLYAAASTWMPRPRWLWLDGDVPTDVADLCEPWRLAIDGNDLRLERESDDAWITVDVATAAIGHPAAPSSWRQGEGCLGRWLQSHGIEAAVGAIPTMLGPRIARLLERLGIAHAMPAAGERIAAAIARATRALNAFADEPSGPHGEAMS